MQLYSNELSNFGKGEMNKFGGQILAIMIGVYQRHLSPLKGSWCIFQCSCSEAVRIAAKTNGFFCAMRVLRFRMAYCSNTFTIRDNIDGVYLQYPDGMCIPAYYIRQEIATVKAENVKILG